MWFEQSLTMGDDHMKMVQKQMVIKESNKTEKGPWVVHRTTKDGRVVVRHRFPSDHERLKNRERERKRRDVARKIFSGLRAYGNYNVSKKADTIELLKALCEEAGWHVEQDGTIYKKGVVYKDDDYCSCGEYLEITESKIGLAKMAKEEHNINLKLSLRLANAFDQRN